MMQQLAIVLTATLASIGTAGIPGAGLVMLAIVLNSVEIPLQGLGIILGVDRFLDMCRTVVNITGDAVCAVVVASTEGQLDIQSPRKERLRVTFTRGRRSRLEDVCCMILHTYVATICSVWKVRRALGLAVIFTLLVPALPCRACFSIVVGKNASAEGCVIVGHNEDDDAP